MKKQPGGRMKIMGVSRSKKKTDDIEYWRNELHNARTGYAKLSKVIGLSLGEKGSWKKKMNEAKRELKNRGVTAF